VSEWAGWTAFVSFARCNGKPCLACYELTPPPASTPDGTPPPESDSLFQVGEDGLARFDFTELTKLPNPSLYRAWVAVAAAGNDWLRHTMQRHGYRELTFAA
jgi:hypothetical protein